MAIPPGFMEVSYVHAATGSTKPMVCVWGHEVGEFGTGVDSHAELLRDFWKAQMMGCINRDISLTEVVVRIGQDGGSPTIESSPGGVAPGLLGARMLPNNTATLVRKNTALGGRRGRGRCYLPPVGEENSDFGRLGDDIIPIVQNNVQAWLGLCQNAGYNPVLLHEGGLVALAPTPITSLSVDPHLATQRRRLR